MPNVMWDNTIDGSVASRDLCRMMSENARLCVIMQGWSGVGKSTWVDNFVSTYRSRTTKNPKREVTVVGIDRQFQNLSDHDRYTTMLEATTSLYAASVIVGIKQGHHIVVDNMNKTPECFNANFMMFRKELWQPECVLVQVLGEGNTTKVSKTIVESIKEREITPEDTRNQFLWRKVYVLDNINNQGQK